MTRRLQAVRADELRVGDVLWSNASETSLRIVSIVHERVRADGNFLGDRDELDGEPAPTDVALTFRAQRASDKKFVSLGAYAPRALLQRVRYVPAASSPPRAH